MLTKTKQFFFFSKKKKDLDPIFDWYKERFHLDLSQMPSTEYVIDDHYFIIKKYLVVT